jgi:type I restriction enzyme, S subunit
MAEFERKSLGEVLGERGYIRGPFGSALVRSELQEKGIPVYEQQHAITGTREFRFFVNQEKFTELSRFRVKPNDLIISCSGTVGRISVIQPNDPMGIISQALLILRPHLRDVLPEFLFYFLSTRNGQHALVQASHGSVQVNIAPRAVVEQIEVPIPSLAEQRAITHVLGTLDDKIELNRRMNKTLEAMAQTLFKSWFVDFDAVRAKAECRDTGLPKDLSDLFPDSFEDSELGGIPKGWRIGALGDVADHPRRSVQPTAIEASTPYIALEHMPRRCIALWEWGTADGLESNKFEFKKGEILFGKLRPYFHKVGVAPLAGVCSTDIVVVNSRTEKWFGFVLGHVSSTAFVEHTNAGSTGTKMPRTSWSEMARYAVVLPPETVAAALTKQIRPSVDRIIASIHESRTLATLRDTLLPKLISGELRVKDAERFVEGMKSTEEI